MADMKKKYNEEVVPALMKKMGYKNVMQVPKLKKIVLSMGIGTKMEKDAFTEGKNILAAISGQLPVITKAKKNVANFKLRVGQPVGVMVTLRSSWLLVRRMCGRCITPYSGWVSSSAVS